jgi:predicted Kef-type K+ transport protein
VGTFAIAWIMTKFTEPLRLGLTVVALPQIAKILGKKDQENSDSK